MSISKGKKEKKRHKGKDDEDELGIDPPDSPFEERQMESPGHQQEDDETSPIQPPSDVGRAPEVGRGASSSDLNATQELLNGPTHQKVAQYVKRVSFWLLSHNKIDEHGRTPLNIDKAANTIYYTNASASLLLLLLYIYICIYIAWLYLYMIHRLDIDMATATYVCRYAELS